MTSPVTISARPESIDFAPSETAVIVVDMQNAYASKCGYLDILGVDLSGIQPVIQSTRAAIDASRRAGM
ncbi:pyrimidine utilization protein B, partial [Leptolyngbya sp. FACHB-36]|nr:pyrimidine utilization protein B [Leptolyngbya sp. FACHB-36]